MSKSATPARQLALFGLRRVLNDRVSLSDLDFGDAAPNDRARALSLVRGALRYLPRLDAVLALHLERNPPQPIRHILRLGAFEILVDEVAGHAAVDQAVRLARGNAKTGGFAGLINAVLRKVVSDGAAQFEALPPAQLPKGFLGQMKSVDADAVLAIERAHEQGAAVDLTPKEPATAEALAEKLGAVLLPSGTVRLQSAAQISALDGFETGDWWVQDAAAAMPVRLFSALAGKRVLDMCAAPGGKTMQMAAAGAKVTALDVSQARMERVQKNLQRTKLTADIVIADALKFEAPKFDAILLDAPCSASGTIRRHPDLPILKSNMDLGDLLNLQRDMLAKAVGLLKPDGELVFATCSLFDAEGISQANWAQKNLKIEPVPFDTNEFGVSRNYQPSPNQLRLRPDYWADRGGMDGFFMAKFKALG